MAIDKLPDKNIKKMLDVAIDDIFLLIGQEREKEIIIRRFGLNNHKETLEQIGELLGVTRERVRQLEKAILTRLKLAIKNQQPGSLSLLEKEMVKLISESGRAIKIQTLADNLLDKKSTDQEKSKLAFIISLLPSLMLIEENDNYFLGVGIRDYGDNKKIKEIINSIVGVIKEHGQPLNLEELHQKLDLEHPDHIQAYASLSKLLASLNGFWGLQKWPSVNPKNIRDKIFVILNNNEKPMHFSEIAKAIEQSSFKRKNVTTQAIHNELIKDDRFVLIGRGIYALAEWGFKRGTVSDVIEEVLKESPVPLHRDEIVRRVLAKRQVKETTVLLNLQSRPQFKRVAKATYILVKTTETTPKKDLLS